jgi:alpha-galactosidase
MRPLVICTAVVLAATGSVRATCPIPAETAAVDAWFNSAFLGQPAAADPKPPGIELIRQDHGILGKNRSSRNTAPLKLGKETYTHGIGTHSTSELRVRLTEPARTFTAEVGIDNNWDTKATHGSVVFVVETAEKELFRSDIRRGSSPPLPVDVDLGGATEFTLRVLDAEDGRSHDQADWAAAAVTLDSGEIIKLQDMPVLSEQVRFSDAIPFSFIYGGKPSAELLPTWRKTIADSTNVRGESVRTITYADPATGLEVICQAIRFGDYPAADWVLQFRNSGRERSPVLERILPLDLSMHTAADCNVVLRYSRGSSCRADDFQPFDEPIPPGGAKTVTPVGGRSSNGWFPFFNVSVGDEGALIAIGWSGQWQFQARRADDGSLGVIAGQQNARFTLEPGECIRTPRILLIRWKGDAQRGHNFCRSLIYNHYTPLHQGKKPLPHTQCNTWFPVGDDGGLASEQNQTELLRAYAPLGIEFLVMDAGWYGVSPHWATNVGYWTPRADTFPRGIQPVGEVSREVGLPFGMWFEPERVCPGSWLDTEHPAWCIKIGDGDRLLNLGLPEAQDWLVEMVSGYVSDVPLGYFRLDFNIDPLPFWKSLDPPDRQGITEIRYIQGLYRVLDTLRERHPDLFFEGCSSGGRRIDIESLARCHTYWRSDLYFNSPANQQMIHGASLYLPGNYINTPLAELTENPYALRSTFGGALCLAWDPRPETFNAHLQKLLHSPYHPIAQYSHQDTDAQFDPALAKRNIEDFKNLRPLALGDFYPLLPYTTNLGEWIAYQFHRADLGQGMVLCFRRGGAYAAVEVSLKGLESGKNYQVTFSDTGETRTMTGGELSKPLAVVISERPGSVMILYDEISNPSQDQ